MHFNITTLNLLYFLRLQGGGRVQPAYPPKSPTVYEVTSSVGFSSVNPPLLKRRHRCELLFMFTSALAPVEVIVVGIDSAFVYTHALLVEIVEVLEVATSYTKILAQ